MPFTVSNFSFIDKNKNRLVSKICNGSSQINKETVVHFRSIFVSLQSWNCANASILLCKSCGFSSGKICLSTILSSCLVKFFLAACYFIAQLISFHSKKESL